jgi:hypothetical protein
MQGRRSRLPTECRKFYPFKGDWERLAEILAPTKVTPTEFMRELLRRQIVNITNRQRKSNVEVPLDDTAIITDLSSQSAEPSETI